MTASAPIANRLVAAGLAGFSLAYLVVAFQIPAFAVGVSVQPGTFPKVLGGLMLLLSVLLFWHRPAPPAAQAPPDGAAKEATRDSDDPPPPPASRSDSPALAASPTGVARRPGRDFLVVLGSMAGYALLLRPLGFLLVTAVYVAAMTWYLGYRRHAVNATVAVGVAAGLYGGVAYGFGIALPTGPLPL